MANHPYNNHREQQVAHRRVGTILSGSPAGAEKHAKGHAFSKLTSKSAASRDNDIAGNKSSQRFARGGKVKRRDDGGSVPTAPPDTKAGGLSDATSSQPAPGSPFDPASRWTNPESSTVNRPPGMRKTRASGGPVFARGGRVKKGGGNTNIAIVLPKGGGPAPGGPAAGPLPMAGPGGPPPMPPPPMGGPGGPPPGLPPGMPMRARGGKVIDGEATKGDIKKWGSRAKGNSFFRGGAATGVGREEKAEHMERRRGEKT